MTKGTRRIGWAGTVLTTAVLAAGLGAAACGGSAAGDAAAAEVPEGYTRAAFHVDGMTCGGCATATRMALKRVDGVRDAGASLGDGGGPGSAWAVYDPEKCRPEELMEAIRAAGFSPRPAGG